MRARLLFTVVAIALIAGFAALNWTEFMRTTPLNFGLFLVDAPLAAIMLGLLTLGLLAFLIGSAAQHSHMLTMERRYLKDLQAQRELADKAEASRFTELRQHLDTHLGESRQREAIVSTEYEKSMMQSQRDLRAQLELMNRTLDARLAALEGRFDRVTPAVDVVHRPVEPVDLPMPPKDHVKA